jgi:putative oxidoreductase
MFEIIASLGLLAALPLRLVMGAAFMAHGYPKLNRQALEKAKGMGLPPAATAAGGLTEFFGGIALFIGFLTPMAALLIALEMVGTTLLSKFRMHKNFLLGYELDITYLAGALTLFLLGAGPLSIDAVLGI